MKYCNMSNTDENEYFPWLVKFTPLLNGIIENTNYDLLVHLLTVYEKNVSKDYSTCFDNRLKSIMLKNHIKNTLNFFYFCWRNIKKTVNDCYMFLNKMTDILKVYLDLEIQINKNVDSANILTALYLYLDNSDEYILKILLMGRYETKEMKKLYCPIFAKFLSSFKNTKESINDFTYVGYLLAFKLWENLVDNSYEKSKIIDMAQQKLGFLMPQMNLELSSIIPNPNGFDMNATWWLMMYGLSNLEKICNDFLELEKKMRSFSSEEDIKNSQVNMENVEEKLSPVKKKVKRKLKKNQLLLIDLTSDNKQVEKIITKKQKPVRPQWLNEIKIKKRNLKNKKSQSKRIKSVEVADVHSNENCDITIDETNIDLINKSIDVNSIENNCENIYQKCDVTLNNLDHVNTSTNDNYNEKSSDSPQNVDENNATCVNSICDNFIFGVLTLGNGDLNNYYQSVIKLLTTWDNNSSKKEYNNEDVDDDDDAEVSDASSSIGTDSCKTLKKIEKNLILWEIFNYSSNELSEFFYPDDQGINPNLLLKKPEEMKNDEDDDDDDDKDFLKNELINEDLEESLFEKIELSSTSSSSSSINYRKLHELKSNISFDLKDLCQSEKLIHNFLPFKKRYLHGRIHESDLNLFNAADL
ncbi:protein PFC0760c-like [Leptopilina boulardi]|uniref:protein PFC0760c-like n=1 Tax=Leptopilina boulardi TaxID=63433 RepID=UPI0021F60908|nr:protein PFC0760c-like [Leptopilina boulardi]XP_051170288.1 protein PFC0760c-like [Leptopilina boulardi]